MHFGAIFLRLQKGGLTLESHPEGPHNPKEKEMQGKRSPRPKWNEAQIAALKEFKERGMSAKEIAATGLLPQSLNAIQKKMGRMHLVQHLKIVKFNERQREEFRRFLKGNWEGRTPQELADLWNQTHPVPQTNKRRVISYLTALGLKIHYGEVQSINKMRRREESIKASATSPFELAELLKASRAIVMRRRMRLGRDIWTGMPLSENELAVGED